MYVRTKDGVYELKENNLLIDYLDFDFEKWEKIAKEKECL